MRSTPLPWSGSAAGSNANPRMVKAALLCTVASDVGTSTFRVGATALGAVAAPTMICRYHQPFAGVCAYTYSEFGRPKGLAAKLPANPLGAKNGFPSADATSGRPSWKGGC